MIDVRRPPSWPAIHDFLVGSTKVVNGRTAPAMMLKSRSFGNLAYHSLGEIRAFDKSLQ
jgi:hypothetical protein